MDRFDVSSFSRSAMVVAFALGTFGCGGGGCSSCESCGLTPIPGAYPLEHRIDNSAQVRLTSSVAVEVLVVLPCEVPLSWMEEVSSSPPSASASSLH